MSATAVLTANRTASVFLPKEHGSWSLALEPIALGLLVAPSPAAGALAMAAISAFFLRRPVKRLGAHRGSQSARAVLLLGLCAMGSFATAVVLGGWTPLLWLTPTLPLAGLFLHWDRQNESRATQAELAASSIFAFLPAAMAAQAGLTAKAAIALGVLVLARSLPTVLIIRTYLRRRKGHRVSAAPAVMATALTLTAVFGLTMRNHLPWIAAILAAGAALRLLLLVPAFAPDWPARKIGSGEACFGVILVVVSGVAWAALLR